MIILITGVAGFIGSFLATRLLNEGFDIIGVDNLNTYYDIGLKEARLSELLISSNFTFVKSDISNKSEVDDLFYKYKPNVVVNLAAQAGVRYSIDNPSVYIESNIIGFYNILEACRNFTVKHLIYASSSSVYGSSTKVPFVETDIVDQPVSLYAATKKSNELMAHTYSHLYKIPTTGLRFFTVYGPKGRPDMAYFSFVDKYFRGESIKIFNNGDFENDLFRDFTYIDDIIEGIVRLIDNPPNNSEKSMHEVYNIGNSDPVKLMEFISKLEEALSISLDSKVEFTKIYESIKPGDVKATYASTDKLFKKSGYRPKTPLSVGLQAFTDWYVEYYKK